MNDLRKKLQNKDKILGTLVSLTDPCLCEIMGNLGYYD
jgi:2-keto-3-deoxy-L-rhamnonate aldolase RhmA